MSLLNSIILNPDFHLFLFYIDKDLAQSICDSNCPFCDKALHQANYPRSPNGMPADQREYYEIRFSFCCSECRKRITPESIRFFGRRWHPAPAHLLICFLKLKVTNKLLNQVQKHLGITISKSTWIRWKQWWQEQFSQTDFWKLSRAQLANQPVGNDIIPRFLVRLFPQQFSDKLTSLLKFLSPITGRYLRGI
jgi:hypothetical protein